MGSTQSPSVHYGPYIDYGRNSLAMNQWLCTDHGAFVWTNLLAVLVTVAFARLFKLVWRVDILAVEYTLADMHSFPRFSNVLNPLLSLRTNEGHILFRFPWYTKEPTIESLGWHMLLEAFGEVRPQAISLLTTGRMTLVPIKEIVSLIIGALIFLGAYIGFIILSILTALLATDSRALSASPDCGIYLANANLATVLNISRQYEFDTQFESATWAERCYHAEDGADGCNFLLQQSINYQIEDNSSCPFISDMCYGDNTSAISFFTDAISARALGINTPGTFEFRRNTTCSPLNMNETFVKLHGNEQEFTFSYHYGPSTELGNWTWKTESYKSNFGQSPAYLVGTVTSNASSYGGWTPIPELTPPAGGMTTLIFIQPQKIYYLAPSNDPIFPANHEIRFPDDETPYWLYTRGQANVLACVDITTWRDLSQGEDWNLMTTGHLNSSVTDPRSRGGFWLFWFSIMNSNTYQAISRRLAGALDAQTRISGFISLPLAPQQWKMEAARFFETSLARTQIDARNIARGAAAKYPGYEKLTRPPPEMCEGTYLFVSEGYTNINQFWSLVIVTLGFLIIICAIPAPDDRLLFEIILRGFSRPLAALLVYIILNVGIFTELAFKTTFSRQIWAYLLTKLKQTPGDLVRAMRSGARDGRRFGRRTIESISTWIGHVLSYIR